MNRALAFLSIVAVLVVVVLAVRVLVSDRAMSAVPGPAGVSTSDMADEARQGEIAA